MDRELDLVHFLKSHLEIKTLIYAMTTSYQRTLARNNFKFVLNGDVVTSSESDFDLDNCEPKSQIEFDLFAGLKKPKKINENTEMDSKTNLVN